jgi:S1-C subfamily serine protease
MKNILTLALAALVTTASASRADVDRSVLARIHSQLNASTAILQYYIETEDGQRQERDALVVLVNDTGLAITTIDYFPPQLRLDDIRDMTLVLGVGDAKKEFPAAVLGRDEEARVVFVQAKLDGSQRTPFLRFEAANLTVGDDVVIATVLDKAFGYPRAFNLGRVNAVLEKPTKMFSTTIDARGVTGAPVFDARGRAVGLNAVFNTTRRGQQQQMVGGRPVLRDALIPVQLPVIIPTERFAALIKIPPTLAQERKWAWIGVTSLQPLTADLAAIYELPKGGIIVGQVVKNSPADKAGLRAEDILLKYGALELKQAEDKLLEVFSLASRQSKIGEPLEAVVWRPSEKKQITLTLVPEPRPITAAEAKRYTNRVFGFTVREVVVDDLLRFQVNQLTGAFVTFVNPSNWAGQGGLRPADVVQKINDDDVATLDEFQKQFESVVAAKPKEIFLQVLRGGKETAIIRIEPRWENVDQE